jgi:eukaryotic-like serine/threonine-protein kinase
MRTLAIRRGWRSMALPARMMIGATALVLIVLGLVFAILAHWAQRSGDAVVRRELEQSADLASQILAGRQRSLGGGARVFVQGPYFRAIVAERRADDILDQTFEAAEQLDADWVFIVDERGTLLAKSDEPGASGADLSAVPLVAGALQGRVMSGFGVSRDSLLFQAVAVPIVVPGGAPIGALVATKMVDSLLARDVKAATSADIVFFVRDVAGNRIAASSLGRSLGRTLAGEVTEQTRSRTVLAGVRYATQGAALPTAGGEIIGGFVVLSARDAASAEIAEVRRALLLAALLGLSLAALAAFVVSRRVTRPVRDLTAIALRAADGDYAVGSVAAEEPARGQNEIAALDDAVHLLVAELRDRQALVAALTASVPALARLSGAATASATVAQSLSIQRVQGAPPRVVGGAARAIGPVGADRPRAELSIGEMVADRYVIDALLGIGELTATYRAKDRATGGIVALKRLRTPRAASDLPLIELVREEVRAVRPLVHRNVVRVHDAGDDDGMPFVTMDYVEGIALDQLLRASGPLPEGAVLSLAKQLCRALAAAEAVGVVHGDVTPKQLLLAYEGVLKVGDFALARIERRLRGSDHTDPLRHAAIPQLAGATVGSPEYMAPEQMLGEAPTTRTDLYAAGVVLYECVTGATPFRTDSPLAFLAQKLGGADAHAESEAMRASQPSRSRAALVLRDVIGRMILPEAERRPASAGALLELLERAG